MAKYLLVSFKTCPWVQRAAIVLREKKVEFEFRHIEPDNRPDWFLAISPHKKVPVLRIDDRVSLFESNAIAEYLDETIAPRLHPEDPIARAVNRAWTDYVPTFADLVTATAYADTEADYNKAAEQDPGAVRAARAGAREAGQRPLFQRRQSTRWWMPPTRRSCSATSSSIGSSKLGHIEKFPRLTAWAKALLERPSTHSFPPAEFEAMYRDIVSRRNKWVSQFIEAFELTSASALERPARRTDGHARGRVARSTPT